MKPRKWSSNSVVVVVQSKQHAVTWKSDHENKPGMFSCLVEVKVGKHIKRIPYIFGEPAAAG